MVLVQKWLFFRLFFRQYRVAKLSFTKFQKEKKLFYAIKTRSLKSRKIGIFQQRLTHGFGPKKAIFSNSFFLAIQARKMSFTINQNEKTPFQGIKTRGSNSRKIDIFPKGLTHGFGPKMAIFPNFFFQASQESKMSSMILQNKKKAFRSY